MQMMKQHDKDYYASSGCVQDMMDALFSAKDVTDVSTIEDRIDFFKEQRDGLLLEKVNKHSKDLFYTFFTGRINEFKQRYKELTGEEYNKCQE